MYLGQVYTVDVPGRALTPEHEAAIQAELDRVYGSRGYDPIEELRAMRGVPSPAPDPYSAIEEARARAGYGPQPQAQTPWWKYLLWGGLAYAGFLMFSGRKAYRTTRRRRQKTKRRR